jgi:hypothetical protein
MNPLEGIPPGFPLFESTLPSPIIPVASGLDRLESFRTLNWNLLMVKRLSGP